MGTIADWVGRGIIEGRLPPGHDLNSVELARQFSTSRTPVREALLLLEKEGLVDVPPRRRPRVATVDPNRLREIYRLRATLLALVSELIVRDAPDEAIALLHEPYDRMTHALDAGDVDAFFWANVDFSNVQAEICGDETLREIIDSLGMRVLRLRYFSISLPDRMARSYESHTLLLRAYEARDEVLAPALARSIVQSALKAIEQPRPPAP